MVEMLTDIGNIRKINEDYINFYESDGWKLYVIADGMGGHNAGEVASKIAVESTIDYIKEFIGKTEEEELLKEAILNANNKVFNRAKENEELGGMGTTITACLVIDGVMYVAHVGDSRCYVIDNEGIKKITKDHSLVQELVDKGSITEEEARKHPNKNIITRALGTNLFLEVDTFKVSLKTIKKVLLCTDGLSNDVSESEMYGIVTTCSENCCKYLIELSKSKGGRDNISVLVFEGECRE